MTSLKSHLNTRESIDFIFPLFTRKGHIILQNEKSASVLHVLGFDYKILT